MASAPHLWVVSLPFASALCRSPQPDKARVFSLLLCGVRSHSPSSFSLWVPPFHFLGKKSLMCFLLTAVILPVECESSASTPPGPRGPTPCWLSYWLFLSAALGLLMLLASSALVGLFVSLPLGPLKSLLFFTCSILLTLLSLFSVVTEVFLERLQVFFCFLPDFDYTHQG
jgi:hypothetical protein